MSTQKPAAPGALPPGVIASDLAWPKYSGKKHDRVVSSLEFYETTAFGWCIATLSIGGRRGSSQRTYAARVSDGRVVRVGQGPHVLRTITVHVRESRAEALKRYTDLHLKGEQEANEVRDRISSNRAMGALLRGRRGGGWL